MNTFQSLVKWWTVCLSLPAFQKPVRDVSSYTKCGVRDLKRKPEWASALPQSFVSVVWCEYDMLCTDVVLRLIDLHKGISCLSPSLCSPGEVTAVEGSKTYVLSLTFVLSVYFLCSVFKMWFLPNLLFNKVSNSYSSWCLTDHFSWKYGCTVDSFITLWIFFYLALKNLL